MPASPPSSPGKGLLANERQRWRERLWPAFAALLLGAVVLGTIVRVEEGSSETIPRVSGPLPGELTGRAPWVANTDDLRGRLQALGLPALAREGTVMHIHAHLDVYVDARRVAVPAGIGIAVNAGLISPLHTHDDSGIVHVESPEVRTFTLGEFFGVWGVRLTPRCLGGYCTNANKRVLVLVDGGRVSGDPRRVVLTDHEEIVVAYGTRAELPR